MRKEVKFVYNSTCNLLVSEKPKDGRGGILSRFRAFFRGFHLIQEENGNMTEWLSKKLNGNIVKTKVTYEDMVWFVEAEVKNEYFLVSVMGTHPCIENQSKEHEWTLHVHEPTMGCFEKRDYHEPMEKLLRKIDAVLKSESEVHKIVWFNRTKQGNPIDEADAPF